MAGTEIPQRHDVDRDLFEREIVPLGRPALLKGLVCDWPAVQRARDSAGALADYVARFDRGEPVEMFVAPPESGGRFFYKPDMSGFNFERRQGRIADLARHLAARGAPGEGPALYAGSAPVPEHLPGFDRDNPMKLLDGKGVAPRIWIGSESVVAPHFDLSDNIACVVAGRRRFTLFPPEQVANLYVGPLDNTMAGQPASMVDLAAPDLERYPRFEEALAASQTAELEPGDALYIPSPWWHHVEAAGPFNVLVNYWWDDAPADAGSPFEAMIHGLFATATLPDPRREAWRALFDHFVFRTNGDPAGHLEPEHRGILAPSTPQLRARVRQFLLNVLSRR